MSLPDRTFVHTLSFKKFKKDVALIASTCQRCCQTAIASKLDGSLEKWEQEHVCVAAPDVQIMIST
jgi:hypothetical protein